MQYIHILMHITTLFKTQIATCVWQGEQSILINTRKHYYLLPGVYPSAMGQTKASSSEFLSVMEVSYRDELYALSLYSSLGSVPSTKYGSINVLWNE
jgi:hypothetical protein